MARSLIQVRETLQLLYAQYDSLAGNDLAQLQGPQRMAMFNKLREVREEIASLEEQEAVLAAVDSGLPVNVTFVQFEEPS